MDAGLFDSRDVVNETDCLLVASSGDCGAALRVCGCATHGYVDARVYGVNYSEDYVPDFSIPTPTGKHTGMGGDQVQEFSRGGLSGQECCAPIPGPGQTLLVEWRVGRHHEPVWDSLGPHGGPSPRIDQLFYGRRIMRQMGD
jgi:hypothetical protein